MPKKSVKEEVGEEFFGCDDLDLFDSTIKSKLGGEILDQVCVPKGFGTGSIKLDMALTIPFPKGYIYEIYAENSVGKTTQALEILGQAQSNGCRVGYLDLEGTLNTSLVSSIRTLNTQLEDDKGQKMWIYKEGLIKDKESGETRIMTGEDAWKYIITYASMLKNSYLVVDSVDALIPSAILEGKDVGDSTIGQLGKLMSDGMRRLHGICKANNSTVIFINQVRTNPGQMFGDPTVTPGGKALAFYAFQRLKLSKGGKADLIVDPETNKVIGHKVKVKVIKNKVLTTNDDPEFTIIYGKGICREYELIELGTMYNLILPWEDAPKRFFNIEGEKVAISKAVEFLIANPTKSEVLEKKIKNLIYGT